MKWEKQYYDNVRGYLKYVCGDYTIKCTHNKNMFTKREMSASNQVWEIFRGTKKIGFEFTLREAKVFVEKKNDEMSKAKEIMNRLPEVAVKQIEYLKYEYSHNNHKDADNTADIIRAYLQGLEDAGLLKQPETRLMYCYGTL